MAASESKSRRRKQPKPATPDRLVHAAESYVARFQATEAMLRDVLMRRVRRTERLHGLEDADRATLLAAIDDICTRYVRVGLIDDAAYAHQHARTLFERGTAPFRIRQRLALKGVAEEVADGALAALAGDDSDGERTACIRLAQRRRLGPFRLRGNRAEYREKDLATLARAGFGYDTARAVVDAEDAADLDA